MIDLLLVLVALKGGPHAAIIQKAEERAKEVAHVKEVTRGTPASGYARSFVYGAHRYRIPYLYLVGMSLLESSYFKHDSCQDKGQANGFGYASNTVCFDSYPEAIESVARELAENPLYQNLSMGKKMCVWQSGSSGPCDYSKKIQAFVKKYSFPR